MLVNGLKPEVISLANKNAPIGNVPSTDISAKSSILNVMVTPMARTENISPCSIDVKINSFIMPPCISNELMTILALFVIVIH
ncbi:hypothetical protein SDC9_207666 [bioreactor metagenome]|uniref:Uncharacterized protein n=1 Tax=bioreactor metagenome TaxID=1076179 RepID=A0A645JJY6_9ZZZZ